MAFYIGSTNVYPGIMPPPSATTMGAPLYAKDTTTGFWAYPGSSQFTPSGALATRSILTHGFVAGGYKDANPWRSVNKTWHANDITIYCGEQLQATAAYIGSTFSDYNGYVHGCAGSWLPASTHSCSYSLNTGVQRTINATSYGANPGGPFGYTGKDPYGDGNGIAYGTSASNTGGGGGNTNTTAGTGTWELSVGRTYFGATVNQLGQVGYIAGGPESTNTDKFYFPTEIMYTTTALPATAGHVTASYGETIARWSIGGTLRNLTYSTDSWTTWSPGTAAATDGTCKILSTKLGYHYVGTGANVTSGWQKFSDSTGSTLKSTSTDATFVKPQALGEENMEMGQNWGYCLGQYNGQQNNYTFKVNYSTDVNSVLGTASQPKGHVGMSSSGTSSAAASVTANIY